MKNLKNLLLLTTAFACDNSPGWKLDDNGNMALKDGDPIYVNSAGEESTVGQGTISRLNGEAKTHREEKQAAQSELASLKETLGDLDIEKAREAMTTVANIDSKQLIDAGEVDKVRDEIKNGFADQITELTSANTSLEAQLNNLKIQDVFKSSEFAKNEIAVPSDMFQATFRDHFRIEDGKVAAYDRDGNRVYSKEKSGEIASPEEALKILVDSHPAKDQILKSDDNSGSGGSNSGGRSGVRRVSRADFEKLQPHQQADLAALVKKGEAQIF